MSFLVWFVVVLTSASLVASLSPVDFRNAYDDLRTGLRCIDMESTVKTQDREKLLDCTHSLVNLCHYTYKTKFKNQREDNCEENFEKICSITFKQQAVNETIKKCYKPMVKECSDEKKADRKPICKTVFESECSTRYIEKQLGKFVGETVCSKIPKQLCGSNSCRFIPGLEECHNKTVINLVNVPEENCDLVPQKTCHGAIKLVPYLSPQHECENVPKEVCSFGVKGTIFGEQPIVTKWCYDPSDGLQEPQDSTDSFTTHDNGSRTGQTVGIPSTGVTSSSPNSNENNSRTRLNDISPLGSRASVDFPDRLGSNRTPGSSDSNKNSNSSNPLSDYPRPGSGFASSGSGASIGVAGLMGDNKKIGSSATVSNGGANFESSSSFVNTGSTVGKNFVPEFQLPPSAAEVINTLGPNPAPVADDVSYEYDYEGPNSVDHNSNGIDYAVPFLEEAQPSTPDPFTPLTTPATTPRTELRGTASADIGPAYEKAGRGARMQQGGSKDNLLQLTSDDEYSYDDYYYDEGDYPEALFYTTPGDKELSKRTTRISATTTPSPNVASKSLPLSTSQSGGSIRSTNSVHDLINESNIKFHKFIPHDLKTIVDLVSEDAKKDLKFAQANGPDASKKAEKAALAKVIQHNDQDRVVDKTVIIKNTPEALKVFGIKNIPKELFDKERQLLRFNEVRKKSHDALSSPTQRNPTQNNHFPSSPPNPANLIGVLSVDKGHKDHGIQNDNARKGKNADSRAKDGLTNSLKIGPSRGNNIRGIDSNNIRANGSNTLGSIDHTETTSTSTAIYIEEVLPTDMEANSQDKPSTSNPFLANSSPTNPVVIKGRASWEIQPVPTIPYSRPIVSVSSSGKLNPKPFPAKGGLNFRQPKNIAQNLAVTKAQSFAIPDKPSGPNKLEKFRKLQQTGLQNTIKNHQALIHPSQVNMHEPPFKNDNALFFPTNIAEILSTDDKTRTSRNPQNVYDPQAQATKVTFSPPPTLQYGFRPLSTPSLPYSTPLGGSSYKSTGGQFSPPNTLMFGFSPLSTATQRPSTYDDALSQVQKGFTPPIPASNSGGNLDHFRSTPHQSNQDVQFENSLFQTEHPSRPRKSRSMMTILQDFFKPITQPLQDIMSG
eukprot:TCALIF_13782-PA protein Name:"Protein of unknown function" AED:0.41 eAED:0.41 QI:0/0/0/0.5/1/1/2/0/1114